MSKRDAIQLRVQLGEFTDKEGARKVATPQGAINTVTELTPCDTMASAVRIQAFSHNIKIELLLLQIPHLYDDRPLRRMKRGPTTIFC